MESNISHNTPFIQQSVNRVQQRNRTPAVFVSVTSDSFEDFFPSSFSYSVLLPPSPVPTPVSTGPAEPPLTNLTVLHLDPIHTPSPVYTGPSEDPLTNMTVLHLDPIHTPSPVYTGPSEAHLMNMTGLELDPIQTPPQRVLFVPSDMLPARLAPLVQPHIAVPPPFFQLEENEPVFSPLEFENNQPEFIIPQIRLAPIPIPGDDLNFDELNRGRPRDIDEVKQVLLQKNRPPRTDEPFQCAICFGDTPEGGVFTTTCNHSFCIKCVAGWVLTLIQQGRYRQKVECTCALCRDVFLSF